LRSNRGNTGVATIVATLLGIAVIAIPLAGLTWDVLSDLISGHLGARKALLGFPAMIVLAIVLRFAARTLIRLDAQRGPTRTGDHS
jgi:phosphotransferase system  glucose/maltose/N-acetylglucosamine-specific IIC component